MENEYWRVEYLINEEIKKLKCAPYLDNFGSTGLAVVRDHTGHTRARRTKKRKKTRPSRASPLDFLISLCKTHLLKTTI